MKLCALCEVIDFWFQKLFWFHFMKVISWFQGLISVIHTGQYEISQSANPLTVFVTHLQSNICTIQSYYRCRCRQYEIHSQFSMLLSLVLLHVMFDLWPRHQSTYVPYTSHIHKWLPSHIFSKVLATFITVITVFKLIRALSTSIAMVVRILTSHNNMAAYIMHAYTSLYAIKYSRLLVQT